MNDKKLEVLECFSCLSQEPHNQVMCHRVPTAVLTHKTIYVSLGDKFYPKKRKRKSDSEISMVASLNLKMLHYETIGSNEIEALFISYIVK